MSGSLNWNLLAVRNIARRPLRTAVTVAGVAIAVAALFSLLAFQRGYERGMQAELTRLGAHILIAPKGCPYDSASIALHGAKWPCYLKARYLDQVRENATVDTAAPAFMNALYDRAGQQTVYVGVERDIMRLRPAWEMEGSFPSASGELLIGTDTARRNRWRVGQTVSLPGLEGKTGRVAGILSPTGGPDDGFLYMRLPDAQKLFGHPDELTHIMVRLKDANQMDHAVTTLRSCSAGMDMNVVPMAHLFETIRGLVGSTRVLLGAVVLIALLIAGTGVANTVLMAVVERTREIGIMRALGASPLQVFRLFWLETLQLCLAGGVAGVLVAFASSRFLETWLRSRLPFAPTESLIHWEWGIVGACVAAGVLLGMVAGLLPAWRAARLVPMEAIRAQG